MADKDKFSKSSFKFDARHDKRIAQIERRIRTIYKKATEEAAAIGAEVKGLGKKPFSFADYPAAKEKADKLIEDLGHSVETTIVDGVRAEWELAEQKNDALSSLFFGNDVDKLTPEQFKRYFKNPDGRAVEAFLQRKAAGLNLSDKVWKYTDGFKEEIEMALDLGIREGKSAAAMSRDLRDYLQHPNKLFRRVRDEHGVLHLSKAAKAFHPSRGVYRSSYMNARRLAVTETNIAYRTADYQRQQQLDFVVGIRIVLSNNHNCKGVPAGMFFDICDELKGEYPKSFMFTGWHPHCRCHVETILKTPAEMKLDTERILHGRPTAEYSRNLVRKEPKDFRNWVTEHRDRILDARDREKLPYFLKDNSALYSQILGVKDTSVKQLTTLDLAAQRHAARTPEQAKKIQDAWNKRKAQYAAIEKEGKELDALLDGISDVDTKTIQEALKRYDLKTVHAEIAKLKKTKQELEQLRWVQDPIGEAKNFSLKQVLETEADVEFRMNLWQNKYKYAKFSDAALDHRKAKLTWEINDEIPNGKYKHPALAEKVLKKELEKVEDAIEFEGFKTKQADYVLIMQKHPKSGVLKKQMDELQDALDAHDKKAVKLAFTKLAQTKKKLEKVKTPKAKAVSLKSPNQHVVIEENTTKSGFLPETRYYYEYDKEPAINHAIKHTNVAKNSFEQFAKTKEGGAFLKSELEQLGRCTTKDEMNDLVDKLKKKYPRKKAELQKLEEVAANVQKECEMQARAVSNFTFLWDYEIRQIHCGNLSVQSIYGHNLADMQERAASIERYIQCAPKWNGGTTYRGMSLSNKELAAMVDDLKKGQGDMLGAASWSADQGISEGFCIGHLKDISPKFGDQKGRPVILRATGHKKGTPIMHLSKFGSEEEVLSSHYERWKFIKMETKTIEIRGRDYDVVFIDVEPA